MVDNSLFRMAFLEQARAHLGAVIPKAGRPVNYGGLGDRFENEYGDGGFCSDAVVAWIYGITEQSGLDPDIPRDLGIGHGTANLFKYARDAGALREDGVENPLGWEPGDIISMSNNGGTTPDVTGNFDGHTSVVLDVQEDPDNPGTYRITTIDANHRDDWMARGTASSVVVEHYLYTPGESNLMVFTDDDWEAGPESNYRRYIVGVTDLERLPQADAAAAVIENDGFSPSAPWEGYRSTVRDNNVPRFDAALEAGGMDLSIVPDRPEPPQTYTVQTVDDGFTREEIRVIQDMLIEAYPNLATTVGNSAGASDGIWGNGSRSVMTRFLTDEPPQGLGQDSAVITQDTLERIKDYAEARIASGEIDSEAELEIFTGALAKLAELDGIEAIEAPVLAEVEAEAATELSDEERLDMIEAAAEEARAAVRDARLAAGDDLEAQEAAVQRAMMEYSGGSLAVQMDPESTELDIAIARAKSQAAIGEYQIARGEIARAMTMQEAAEADLDGSEPVIPPEPSEIDAAVVDETLPEAGDGFNDQGVALETPGALAAPPEAEELDIDTSPAAPPPVVDPVIIPDEPAAELPVPDDAEPEPAEPDDIEPEPEPEPAVPDEPVEPDLSGGVFLHEVVWGDTISQLARDYGITQNELRDANGIPHNSDVIYAGQELNIPVAEATPAVVAAVEPEAEAAAPVEPDLHTAEYRPDLSIAELFDGVARPNELDVAGRATLDVYSDMGLSGIAAEALQRAEQSGLLNVKYQGIRDFAQHLLVEHGGDGIAMSEQTQAQGVELLQWAAEMGNAQAIRDLAIIAHDGLEPLGLEADPERGYAMMRSLIDGLETRKTEALAEVDNYKWTSADNAALSSARDIVAQWEAQNPELRENFDGPDDARLATDGAIYGTAI